MAKRMVVNIVGDVVKEVRKLATGYDPLLDADFAPYYMHGHWAEIVQILSEKSKGSFKFKKYPAVILLQDFKEEDEDYLTTVKLNIVLVAETKANYTAIDRYNETFTKVLYPLYDKLKAAFEKSPYFHQYTFDWSAIDHLYLGKSNIYGNSGNIANDFLDAIEIENLSLTIEKTC